MKELPDLKCAEVAAAAVKIQKVYRGFQTRKKVEQDLPNLKCAKVVKATVRIQKVFRGYQTRKRLEMAQTAATAVKVQKVSKGFKVSKKNTVLSCWWCYPCLSCGKLLTSCYPTSSKKDRGSTKKGPHNFLPRYNPPSFVCALCRIHISNIADMTTFDFAGKKRRWYEMC